MNSKIRYLSFSWRRAWVFPLELSFTFSYRSISCHELAIKIKYSITAILPCLVLGILDLTQYDRCILSLWVCRSNHFHNFLENEHRISTYIHLHEFNSMSWLLYLLHSMSWTLHPHDSVDLQQADQAFGFFFSISKFHKPFQLKVILAMQSDNNFQILKFIR